MVEIRQARPEDGPGIAAVHIRSWQKAYEDVLPGDFLAALDDRLEDRAEFWASRLASPEEGDLLFVAVDDDQVIGFAHAGPSREEDVSPASMELYAVYLDPSRFRQGIGSRLWRAMCSAMQEEGVRHATLWVLADNERARAFYHATGWHHDGSEEDFTIDGADYPGVRYRTDL